MDAMEVFADLAKQRKAVLVEFNRFQKALSIINKDMAAAALEELKAGTTLKLLSTYVQIDPTSLAQIIDRYYPGERAKIRSSVPSPGSV